MILKQDNALQVISMARTYLYGQENSYFSEAFIRATFVLIPDDTAPRVFSASIDISGPVPLPPNIPISFDCKNGAYNTSNILIDIPAGSGNSVVVVYWTQYANFQWNKE